MKFLGCRRVRFFLKKETRAPGLAQEHAPTAPSCCSSHWFVPGLGDTLQLGLCRVKNANEETLHEFTPASQGC